jgi:D-3-phosphoglycerate dehydrogenase
MSRFTVLVTDYAWPALDIEKAILAGVDAGLLVAETGDEDELVALAPRADAILTNWKRVPADALDAASECLVVSRFGVGLDNIPVDRATELGMVVTNVPGFCVEEVADHAMALLLACARRVVSLARETRSGTWTLEHAGGLPRLRGQTLGLIGFGDIARRLVPRARAFGLEVIAYTPRLSREALPEGVRAAASLQDLLRSSDYVSIHAPSAPETRGLIGEAELRAMKSSAYLINTSRGALVDEEALRFAIESGWIAGAGLDVLSEEPPRPDHPLLRLDAVIVTPHVAFYSEAAIAELERKAAENVADVLSGRVPKTIVNPAVLDSPALRMRRAN